MCRCLRSTLPPVFSSRFTYILLYICRRRGRAATRQGFNGILFTGFVLRLGKHSLLRPRVCFLPPHPPLSLSLPPSSLFATLPSCCVSQFLGSVLTSSPLPNFSRASHDLLRLLDPRSSPPFALNYDAKNLPLPRFFPPPPSYISFPILITAKLGCYSRLEA